MAAADVGMLHGYCVGPVLQNASRHSTHPRPGRDIADDHRVRADHGPLADPDRAQKFGACSNRYLVFNDGRLVMTGAPSIRYLRPNHNPLPNENPLMEDDPQATIAQLSTRTDSRPRGDNAMKDDLIEDVNQARHHRDAAVVTPVGDTVEI